jgi:hypothetical protein
MRLRSSVRILGLAVALAGALATTPLSAVVTEYFDGGGYGSTAESAVYAAIGDARTTASAFGLYRCKLDGTPSVFRQPSGSLRAYRAQVRVQCEP